MWILGSILTAVLLSFFLFTALSTAHIISLKFRSDNRHLIPFSDFEFSNVGYVSAVISSATVTSTSNSTSSRPDPSRIGFFFQSRDEEPFDFQQNTSICDLDFKSNSVLFTFQNLSQSSLNKSWPMTDSGMKSFFFVNCNNESHLTMEGHVEFYNILDHGTKKNYLSPGLTQLPFVYFIFSFIYLSFLGVCMLLCLKNSRSFNRTHLLIGLLLVMNIVHFMCVAADLRYVKVTGNSDGWDTLFRISKVARAVLLFTVITLIGAGWLIWKPFLEVIDKLVLITVILLQVWANVDPIMPWEAAVPYNEEDASYADILCCVVISIPMFMSNMSLEEISETHLNADRNLGKLSFFMVVVFAYVIISKFLVLGMPTRLGKYVGEEISLLVLCMVMFYMFRPVDRKRLNEFYSPV